MSTEREIRFSYVYKIEFEDGSWYWGVRLCPKNVFPTEDKYTGSPVTHREKWKEKFKKSVVKEFEDYAEATAYEIELIRRDWENNLCLNENCKGAVSRVACSKGGQKAAEKTRGVPRSEEIREKISKAHKGKKLSAAHIEKLKTAERPPITVEQRQKYTETRRASGKPWHSEETRKKIGSSNIGRKVADDSRKKISETLKGKNRKWYTNGQLEVLADSCPDGWRPGRVFRPKS